MTLNEWFKQANFKGYKMPPLVSSGKDRSDATYLYDVPSPINSDDKQRIAAAWMGYDDMPDWYDPKLRRRLRDKVLRDNKPENKPEKVVGQPELPLTPNDVIVDPVRKVLNDIDEVLKHDTQQAQDLWLILSALRGPDSGTSPAVAAKDTFTCFIRSKAFPKTAEAKKNGIGGVHYPQFHYLPGPMSYPEYGTLDFHYTQHLNSAAEAMIKREIITKDECPEQIRAS